VINVVKTAHEFLVCTTVGTPTEDDTCCQPINTEQDVLSVFRKDVLVPLDDTTVSVKDLYSRFRMWNKNQYCIASCDVENYGAVL
jgi:hypothetical protein